MHALETRHIPMDPPEWRVLNPAETNLAGPLSEEEKVVKAYIDIRTRLHGLFRIYPIMHRTAIQHNLGANCPSSLWDLVLKDMAFTGELGIFECKIPNAKQNPFRRGYFNPQYTFPPVQAEQLKELQEKAALWDEEHQAEEGDSTTDSQGNIA